MKSNSNKNWWISAGFVLLIFLASPDDSIAGMAVSPLQQWVVVKPGKRASFSVTITNTKRGPEARPCTVSVEVVDFTVSPEGGIHFGQDYKHGRSAAEWISFDADEFTLEAGQSKEIKAKVSPPISADGDYWAAIMCRLGNPKNRTKGVRIQLQTASGVFVHAARRNYIERGSIIDANITLPEFLAEESFIQASVMGQISQESGEEPTLTISAELKNDGLVAFQAKGKAFLYSGKWRRMASMPLYTSRKRILPGHTRCFTGVMSQPFPAGCYKLRLIFEPASPEYGNNIKTYGRKIIKDMELTVGEELARQWAENFMEDSIEMLELKPKELQLSLNPGRFTAAQFLVANRGLSTVSIRCRQEAGTLPEGWLKLKSDEFALAPNTRRSVNCSVRIPIDVQPGQYNGTIRVEVERSGLIVQGRSNIELHKIPIRIAVNK